MKTSVLLVFLVILIALFSWANFRGQALPTGLRADRVVIEKSGRRLIVLQQGKLWKVYRIALGRAPVGHKEREGDNRTPEGLYSIDFHKKDSAFHRALHITYPNSNDIRLAHAKGIRPGGSIMIHSIRNGLGWLGSLHTWADWTAGCIAVTNWEIEELWNTVPNGTPVEIRP